MKFHIHVIDDPDNHSFCYIKYIKLDIKFLLIIFLISHNIYNLYIIQYRLNNKLYINFVFKKIKFENY